jgi:hypothetical protein
VVAWTFIVHQINQTKKSCQTKTVGLKNRWHNLALVEQAKTLPCL